MTRDEIHRQFEDVIIDKHKLNGLTCEEDKHSQIELDSNKLVIDLQVVQDPRPKSEQLLDCLVSAISTLDPISSAALPADPPPVAERSLLVLLLLASQWKKSGQDKNKFRESIKLLKDAQVSEDSDMAISFRVLYQLICR
ncbi:12767_t:CDS:2 [Racocetra fulgida]|uniref:12767_t:CDS:1 n=1 Tax=Racocetra fulgida TaxID=60492 RepID=A0A9N8WFF5_9GLOM|nr:12767_t:CDS:2 [Racocetra fulgida]